MSGSRSRTKGHDWEREIVRDMTESRSTPYTTSRQSRPDLDARGVDVFSFQDPFIIQAKVGKAPRVRAALREVVGAVDGLAAVVPVAAIRWNRGNGMEKDDVAVLRWADFLNLIQYVHAPRERPDILSTSEDGL